MTTEATCRQAKTSAGVSSRPVARHVGTDRTFWRKWPLSRRIDRHLQEQQAGKRRGKDVLALGTPRDKSLGEKGRGCGGLELFTLNRGGIPYHHEPTDVQGKPLCTLLGTPGDWLGSTCRQAGWC